jgi:hypothetical protein
MSLILLGTGIVSANAAPPPAKLWLTFVYPTESHPRLEGVQWLFCADKACITPTFVQAYGVCTGAGCVLNPPSSSERMTSACAGERCLMTMPYDQEYKAFKLVAQFSDGVRASPVTGGLPTGWGDDRAWQVQVQGTGLVLTEDTAFVAPESTQRDFLSGFALTLVVELLVAAVGLWLWKKAERELLAKRLVMVGLINLLTYPLVWLVFPSLQQFQRGYLRTLSVYVAIAFVIYAAALVWIYLPKDKSMRRLALIMTLLSLPVTGIILLLTLVVTGYGNYAIAVPGLTPALTLLLTEVFVVLAEGMLLYVLSRKSLSLIQAGVVSLLMNLASFLVGQAIF